ncbi:MAG: hypothetical protein IT381_05220 [Deltaproteobacteria bacterium]|nr:hypothetical protein [Deltaproteobacteria bacterium]
MHKHLRAPLLSLGLLASSLDGGADGCDACDPKPPAPVDTTGAHTITVLGVRLADDDGSYAATVTRAQFQSYMDKASEIYQRSGAKLTFVVAPETDWNGHTKSTLMNHDCVPKTTHPETFTDAGLDPDAICDHTTVSDARNAFALKYPQYLVIFLRYGNEGAVYENGHWALEYPRKATGGYSGRGGHHVAGVGTKAGSTFYAHEMGHYLHLAHPFTGKAPASLSEAQQQVTAYLDANIGRSGFDPIRDGLFLYDGDRGDNVFDTPPDPRSGLFSALYGDACDPAHPTVDIEVSVDGVPYKLTAAPDRQNVMSYFKGCPFDMHISKDQTTRVYRALLALNRQRLLHPELASCYAGNGLADDSGTYADRVTRRVAIIDDCIENAAAPAATPQGLAGRAARVSLPAIRASDACELEAE